VDEAAWLQEMHSYADCRLGLNPLILSLMLEVAEDTHPWNTGYRPDEWADEYTRERRTTWGEWSEPGDLDAKSCNRCGRLRVRKHAERD
jgi:hypothetical protein